MIGDQYVFGYGSLAAGVGLAPTRERRAEGFIADLQGFARGWGVAMDNTVLVPGYKCYVDADGARPAVFVAFLDVVESAGGRVNGVCLPVGSGELAVLDARERNYDRVDVSDRVAAGGARVWTYVGSADGRARFRRGVARGATVIHAGYLDAVYAGFAALGAAEWEACAPSLAPRGLPVRALVRRELA
jgi:gamma-glutamylcyclotransferase (GGCT)/AIG2-like uncharacterized protein YtfP